MKITVDKALLEQALEAMRGVAYGEPCFGMPVRKTMKALESALAEPAVEPVAEITGVDEYGPKLGWYKHWALFPVGTKLYTPAARKPSQILNEVRAMFASPQPPAESAVEPVASIYITPSGDREVDDWKVPLPVGRTELFTAQPRKAAKLTDEAIVDGFCSQSHNVQFVSVFRSGVRWAEKQHGIGGG